MADNFAFRVKVMPPKRPGQAGIPLNPAQLKPVATFLVPSNTRQTFADVWKDLQARYEANYPRHVTAQGWFHKLQTADGCDIDLRDKVGLLGFGPASPAEQLQLVMLQNPIDRDGSIAFTSHLRPPGFNKRRLSVREQEHVKRRRIQEERYGAAIEDLDQDMPVTSKEATNANTTPVLPGNDCGGADDAPDEHDEAVIVGPDEESHHEEQDTTATANGTGDVIVQDSQPDDDPRKAAIESPTFLRPQLKRRDVQIPPALSRQPSQQPSRDPSREPSEQPLRQPSRQSSRQPSHQPIREFSRQPSQQASLTITRPGSVRSKGPPTPVSSDRHTISGAPDSAQRQELPHVAARSVSARIFKHRDALAREQDVQEQIEDDFVPHDHPDEIVEAEANVEVEEDAFVPPSQLARPAKQSKNALKHLNNPRIPATSTQHWSKAEDEILIKGKRNRWVYSRIIEHISQELGIKRSEGATRGRCHALRKRINLDPRQSALPSSSPYQTLRSSQERPPTSSLVTSSPPTVTPRNPAGQSRKLGQARPSARGTVNQRQDTEEADGPRSQLVKGQGNGGQTTLNLLREKRKGRIGGPRPSTAELDAQYGRRTSNRSGKGMLAGTDISEVSSQVLENGVSNGAPSAADAADPDTTFGDGLEDTYDRAVFQEIADDAAEIQLDGDDIHNAPHDESNADRIDHEEAPDDSLLDRRRSGHDEWSRKTYSLSPPTNSGSRIVESVTIPAVQPQSTHTTWKASIASSTQDQPLEVQTTRTPLVIPSQSTPTSAQRPRWSVVDQRPSMQLSCELRKTAPSSHDRSSSEQAISSAANSGREIPSTGKLRRPNRTQTIASRIAGAQLSARASTKTHVAVEAARSASPPTPSIRASTNGQKALRRSPSPEIDPVEQVAPGDASEEDASEGDEVEIIEPHYEMHGKARLEEVSPTEDASEEDEVEIIEPRHERHVDSASEKAAEDDALTNELQPQHDESSSEGVSDDEPEKRSEVAASREQPDTLTLEDAPDDQSGSESESAALPQQSEDASEGTSEQDMEVVESQPQSHEPSAPEIIQVDDSDNETESDPESENGSGPDVASEIGLEPDDESENESEPNDEPKDVESMPQQVDEPATEDVQENASKLVESQPQQPDRSASERAQDDVTEDESEAAESESLDKESSASEREEETESEDESERVEPQPQQLDKASPGHGRSSPKSAQSKLAALADRYFDGRLGNWESDHANGEVVINALMFGDVGTIEKLRKAGPRRLEPSQNQQSKDNVKQGHWVNGDERGRRSIADVPFDGASEDGSQSSDEETSSSSDYMDRERQIIEIEDDDDDDEEEEVDEGKDEEEDDDDEENDDDGDETAQAEAAQERVAQEKAAREMEAEAARAKASKEARENAAKAAQRRAAKAAQERAAKAAQGRAAKAAQEQEAKAAREKEAEAARKQEVEAAAAARKREEDAAKKAGERVPARRALNPFSDLLRTAHIPSPPKPPKPPVQRSMLGLFYPDDDDDDSSSSSDDD